MKPYANPEKNMKWNIGVYKVSIATLYTTQASIAALGGAFAYSAGTQLLHESNPNTIVRDSLFTAFFIGMFYFGGYVRKLNSEAKSELEQRLEEYQRKKGR